MIGTLKVTGALLVSLLLLPSALAQKTDGSISEAQERQGIVRCVLDTSDEALSGSDILITSDDLFGVERCKTELLEGFAIKGWTVIDKAGSTELIEIELSPENENRCQPGGNAAMFLCLMQSKTAGHSEPQIDVDSQSQEECRYGGKVGRLICAQKRRAEIGFGWILPAVLILGIGSWVWSFVSSRAGKRNAGD